MDKKIAFDFNEQVNLFMDDDHLSWIADTYHTMIFETLAGDYHDVISRLMNANLEPVLFDNYLLKLNRSYIYALKYFGV
jgi:hypothetical protein